MNKNDIMHRKMEKTGDELSVLGYGCMRFPRKNGRLDEDKIEKQIVKAIENGVNYFDTAYVYPGSEKLLGKILAKGYREKVKIATKIPIPPLKTKEDINKIFEKQLERLQTDYIDYYMVHNFYTIDEWENLKNIGFLEFIDEEKSKGRINNFGFSFHGNLLNFKALIDDYSWDFCMIQYNYLDDEYQAGSEGLKYAESKEIDVIAMEPLRGGLLVNKLPDSAENIIKNFETKRTPAEWAFRWVLNHPGVKIVLSGMNDESQVDENIAMASDCLPNSLTKSEEEMLNDVKSEIKKKIKVDCTSCAYCLPCPKGVDIPFCLSSYNDKHMFGGYMVNIMYAITTSGTSNASKCTRCGVCENKCPQNIAIGENLKEVSSKMDKWYYKLIGKIAKFVMYNQ